jgi:4a-hydroxytetrahydrobiopterin dehydratase
MSTEPAQLISKSCTPCRGGIPPLTPDEAKAHLRQTPEWALLDDGHRIERTFRFKNFAEAFAFVQRAADLAEAEGHHHHLRLGLRDRVASHPQDQGPARERFHHGSEAGSCRCGLAGAHSA